MSVPPEIVDVTPNAAGPSAEERQWATFAHLAALAGFVVPFGNIVGPLVIWLIKKETMPFVDEQGKEAVNFNITVAIAAIVCWLLVFVLIGFLLLPALIITWLVFVILATVKANAGEHYRYPIALRLVS
mgnify:CR=1 FL=1